MSDNAARYVEFMRDSKSLWLQLKINRAISEYEESIAVGEQIKADMVSMVKLCVISLAIIAMITFL